MFGDHRREASENGHGASENGHGRSEPSRNGSEENGQCAIEIDNVTKAFDGKKVLDGCSLAFPEGSVTTILGPSGTGKSVLLKHILALLYPDEGDIRVFGESVPKMKDKELYSMRESFGVLFQDGALFGSMNLYDNTAFPLRQHTKKPEDEIREIVMQSLGEVGLEGSDYKMPAEISGGMRKRAGFARALVLNPKIVLFDEPDSGLDPVRVSLLNDLIGEIHDEHGGTYIIVTHDISTARNVSDYIGLLWHGQAVHYGPKDEAFESDDEFVRQFLAGDSAGPLGMD